MFEFLKARTLPCPICLGRGQIVVDDVYTRCPGCKGEGWTKETSERTS